MINTSSSVKPRVVIFHMTASQLIRSIAPISEARAMPNFVAHASAGKALGLAENRSALTNVERVETVDCVRSYAEEVAAQCVKTSTRLEFITTCEVTGDRNFATCRGNESSSMWAFGVN
jgi:hypothetical protein